VPDEHVAFLEGLPALLETPGFVFVHAGLRPGIAVARQQFEDLIWYRDDFAETYETLGSTVVHGHTIRDEVLVSPGRIALDTGAFATGRLSAVRLAPGLPPLVFEAN
jgi:serine/threonine protein phosphatase 1